MKNEIENTFGAPLEWMLLDDKKACRIQFSHTVDDYNMEGLNIHNGIWSI